MTTDRIYLSPPHMGGIERQLMDEAYDSNWVAPLGPFVDRFERTVCEFTGSPHSVALSSGTAAIHLALIMLGVTRGDRVFCSAFTFSASANPIVYQGAEPVFIDSDAATWTMDPELLREALRTAARQNRLPKAVIVVDLYGQCADYDAIQAACDQYGVPLVEDAAEALGSTYRGHAAGTFGAMGVLSFNGNKIITTGGGGMLLSSNEQYTSRGRFLATQARDAAPHYQHSAIGFNYRMSNILAAIGVGQMQYLNDRVETRRRTFERYSRTIGSLPGVSMMPEADYGTCNRWLTCITIDEKQLGVSREDIRLALEAENIESRPLWKPMHQQPVFRDCEAFGGSVSSDLFERGLCLPSGSALSDRELERIESIVYEKAGMPAAAR